MVDLGGFIGGGSTSQQVCKSVSCSYHAANEQHNLNNYQINVLALAAFT